MTQKKKEPFSIDENLDCGMVKVSDTKGFKISLVSKDGKRFIALTKGYTTKAKGEWKPTGAVWIPFDSSKEVMQAVYRAYETGLKLEWGKES